MTRTLLLNRGWLLAILLPVICLAGAGVISLAISIPDEDDFNVVSWELRHVPNKWLYLTGGLFRGGLSPAEEDERLARFFALTVEIEEVERSFSSDDVEELQRLLVERDELENDAEAIIEGRLTAVLDDVGLGSSLPLFPDAHWVFPPVDVEFDEPPRSLSISSRTRIELLERRPLRPGLSLDEAVDREQEIEQAGDVSALVGGLSGVGTYPTLVAPRGDYHALVSTVAHEWAHNYLFFKPLGARYYDSNELRTLNETAADLGGSALAALVVERYPLPAGLMGGPEPRPAPTVDVDVVLRELRLDVVALLSAGQVEAAEGLMEERRLALAEEGIMFRRINQAFFAARGLYATTPGSVDPIGGDLRTLLDRADGIGEFLKTVAQFRSVRDLSDALRR